MSTDRGFARLRSKLERIALRRDPLPPPTVLVERPGYRFEFGDLGRPYHCASIDKVMTATLIARLVERRRLRFDAPLGEVLPEAVTRGLPTAPGVNVARDITVTHLLSHTSGFPDYFFPPRGHRSSASMANVVARPDRGWRREQLLDAVRELPAVGRPGERFEYSDTAYVLLHRIGEEAAGEAYAPLMAREVFEPSGMRRTRVAYDDSTTQEKLAALDIAPIHLKGVELSRRMAATVAWGSIATTADDLISFQRALHAGELIGEDLLAHLTRPRNRMRRGIHYGAGAVTLRFEEFAPILLRGMPQPVGGLGLSAAHLFYYPQQQAHVVLNFHSDRAMNASFRTHIAIARLLNS